MSYKILETLYENTDFKNSESLYIVVSNNCVYKLRTRQTKQGKVDLFLSPGQSEDGFTFPLQEVKYLVNKHNLIFDNYEI